MNGSSKLLQASSGFPLAEFFRALLEAGSMFVSNLSETESRLDLPPDRKMDLLCFPSWSS